MKEKITLKTIRTSLLFLVLVLAFSCKKKTELDEKTIQLDKLSATWSVSQAENDGSDVTSQYSGFTLTVDQLNYTTQNGGNPWPSSGTYDFKQGDLFTLVRSDGTEIKIEELTSTSLILSFNYTAVNGRTSGVTGDFTFSMTK